MKLRSKVLLGFLAAIPLAIIVLLLWLAGTRSRARTLAEEAGIPWPVEYVSEEIPDEENAAVLYRAAWNALEPEPDLRPTEEPQEETARREAEAYDALLEATYDELDGLQDHAAVFRRYLDRNEEAIDLLLQAARLEKCDFQPLRFLDFQELALTSEHLPKLRSSGRILWAAAVAAAASGEPNRAFEYCWGIYRMASHLSQESIVISQCVRCALLSMASSALQATSSLVDISQVPLERLDEELRRFIQLDPWFDLRMEKIQAIRYLKYGVTVFAPSDDEEADDQPPSSPEPTRYTVMSFLADFNIVTYLRFMKRLEGISRQPYWEAREELKKWESDVEKLRFYHVFAQLMLGAMSRYPEQVAKTRARVIVTRLGLALAACKHQTGSYPDRLESLVPAFIDEIPLDPLTGNPLKYLKEESGVVVYSVGRNLTDDGGKYEYSQRPRRLEKDDIAWHAPL